MATISVVMPNYNHSHYLPVALDAILSSSRLPDEILVIDDCSQDDSCEVIGRYAAREPRIRALANPRNLGVVSTMNRGLTLASGDYLAMLAADDCVEPNFFADAAAQLDLHARAGFCSGLSYGMDAEGNRLGAIVQTFVRAALAES